LILFSLSLEVGVGDTAMSMLRYDVTTNDWVVFAPERARRPHDLQRVAGTGATLPPGGQPCPFCPGNERLTGPEIYALRDGTAPNTPGWTVRVVPNKFPVLRIEEDHHRHEEGLLFRFMGGCGAHEVIIETPEHNRPLAQQPVEHVEFVLRTLQLRYNDLVRDVRFQTIVIFKNHGEGAGTSLSHPHWQLIATPVVPRTLRLKHAVATDYFDQTGTCLYCALLEEELALGQRVVAENEHYAAIAPYASRVPFEMWLLPKVHHPSFGWEEPARLRPLAGLLKAVLGKLHQALDNPNFNLTINTAPRGDEDKRYFLWHIEILPRLTNPAGFELGSGMAINTVLPEDAANFLREVKAP
jgi:UDPglucose--hexose-1-phosphate uridylyltransferase